MHAVNPPPTNKRERERERVRLHDNNIKLTTNGGQMGRMEESARKKGVTQIYLWNRLKLDQSERSSPWSSRRSFQALCYIFSNARTTIRPPPPEPPNHPPIAHLTDDDDDSTRAVPFFCFSWFLLEVQQLGLDDARNRSSLVAQLFAYIRSVGAAGRWEGGLADRWIHVI